MPPKIKYQLSFRFRFCKLILLMNKWWCFLVFNVSCQKKWTTSIYESEAQRMLFWFPRDYFWTTNKFAVIERKKRIQAAKGIFFEVKEINERKERSLKFHFLQEGFFRLKSCLFANMISKALCIVLLTDWVLNFTFTFKLRVEHHVASNLNLHFISTLWHLDSFLCLLSKW